MVPEVLAGCGVSVGNSPHHRADARYKDANIRDYRSVYRFLSDRSDK